MEQTQKLIITKWKQGILSMLLEDDSEIELHYETLGNAAVGNIYIARVKDIVKNINAAFVEIAPGQTCYLSIEDARHPVYLNRINKNTKCLVQGDEILVQVMKDRVKTKDAVVTTNLSFTGKYAVLTTGNHKLGVSMKLEDSVRRNLKKCVEAYVPEDVGVVIRTNAAHVPEEELIQEIQQLDEQRKKLIETAQHRTCFSVMYQAPEKYLMLLRDLNPKKLSEIITDEEEIFQRIQEYCGEQNDGNTIKRLRLYADQMLPLSKAYSIESRLEKALSERVWLKSGGYLIIQPTEALTVIDVNTGKYGGKKDLQETFLKINLEAAEEVARQLRLRNISGIVIVDFINMERAEKKKQLMDELTECVKKDRVKTDVLDMTVLGLVEMTRKKVDKPLCEVLTVINKEN